MARAILRIEDGVIFQTLTEAAKDVNRSVEAIWKALNGKSKTCGGYHWQYI